jgi:PAS domain S-box-containing protein
VESLPAILLAEDDRVARRLLTRILNNAGYEVEAVADGRAALERMSARYYPLLVTDWEMPEMDGIALCKAVRQLPLEGYVYALLLTGRDAKENVVTGLEAGADDYLVKPVHEPELMARLNTGRRILMLEQSLKASSERNRTLIENTSAVPWELDGDGRIIYLAPQMRTIFHIPAEVASAPATFAELLHTEDRAAFLQFIRRAAASEAEPYFDCRIVASNHPTQHVRSFVTRQSEVKNPLSICGISLDITQQKNLELELMRAQKLESIGQLSAGIAHEINTPAQFIGDNIRFVQESLTSILGLARHAAAQADPAGKIDLDYLEQELPKAIGESLEGVKHISKIVAAMKEFASPGTEKAPYDLNRAIGTTITVARNEWSSVADIKTDLDPNLPNVPVIPGDFNQVILNILVNAAQAVRAAVADTPGARGTITVSTRRRRDCAEICIRDTGVGIPENIRGRIFDPFFTTRALGQGLGQGLAVAHDVIVNRHHGAISVESEEAAGATFTLRLPLEAVPESASALA